MGKGFTLIELIVVIAIIAILSGIILFAITQYISKGKDSNISGNLAILIPAGEVFYNGNNNSYNGFCDLSQNSVIKNAILQMPVNSSSSCYSNSDDSSTWTTNNSPGNPAGLCCDVGSDGNSWAACVPEFTNSNSAYCVDNRGVKEEMDTTTNPCIDTITQCP